MPPKATAPVPLTEEQSETFLLGQISGQLRELIHLVNNISTKQDALALRVAALEAAEQRREGASNLLGTILKSPALGWLLGASITAWAILTGKIGG